MRKIAGKLYHFAYRFIQILCLGLTGLLLISGFLFTCYSEDMTSQLVLRRWDNPVVNLSGMLLLGVCLAAVSFRAARDSSRKRLLLLAVLGWTGLTGLLLVVYGRTVPAADSMSVYSIAETLAAGNYSVIHPTESYLSYYPQQVGLAAYYEVIIRVWNLLPFGVPAYHIIKCINVLWTMLLIYSQYKTVGLLFSSDRADCLYLALAGANAPLLFYTSFVYGELPSFALFSAGLWALTYLLKSCTAPAGRIQASAERTAFLRPARLSALLPSALSLVFFTGSVLLRKNTLILIIAAALVLLFQWMKTGRHGLLLLAALCMAGALTALPAVQKLYELRADSSLNSGVPAMSYFAMGMQPSSRANGWYNGFNFETYRDTGMDTARTVEMSKLAIKDRLRVFSEDPYYAAAFYGNKFLSQWADGTYACRQATLATFGGRSALFREIYEGGLGKYLVTYCNAYQNLLYLGAFCFSLLAVKRREYLSLRGLPLFTGLIGVIGGFLFHMLWEANARYILPYGLLLLPYCAFGLERLAALTAAPAPVPDSGLTLHGVHRGDGL